VLLLLLLLLLLLMLMPAWQLLPRRLLLVHQQPSEPGLAAGCWLCKPAGQGKGQHV
jgi:hypothetical protein